MIFALQIHTGTTDGAVLIHQQCTNTLRISLSRWEGSSSKHKHRKKCLAGVFHPFALPKWYVPEKLLLKFQLYTYILVLGVQNCKL